jgi:hypothetical protein
MMQLKHRIVVVLSTAWGRLAFKVGFLGGSSRAYGKQETDGGDSPRHRNSQ